MGRNDWKEFMTPEQEREDRVGMAVDALEKMVNDMGFNPEMFVKKVANLHRTLQQGVMRAFLAWCDQLDRDFNRGNYDLRNEETCKVAHKIMVALDGQTHLPFI